MGEIGIHKNGHMLPLQGRGRIITSMQPHPVSVPSYSSLALLCSLLCVFPPPESYCGTYLSRGQKQSFQEHRASPPVCWIGNSTNTVLVPTQWNTSGQLGASPSPKWPPHGVATALPQLNWGHRRWHLLSPSGLYRGLPRPPSPKAPIGPHKGC